MIITNSTTNEFYLNQLLAFLSSIRENSPFSEVQVDLINPDLSVAKKLKSIFSEYMFNDVYLDLKDTRGYDLIIYRTEQLIYALNSENRPVTWLDTDTLVRGDLAWFTSPDDNELRILKRESDAGVKFSAPINAGIFSIGASPITKKFAKMWNKYCLETFEWGAGQPALWKAYELCKEELKLTNIGHKYNDIGGSDRPGAFSYDSTIWHCKKKHFDNPKFQKEFQHYLGLVKDKYYA